MDIKSISRTYSRSMSFKKPDGTEIWVKHEAYIEATPSEIETSELASCFKDLELIAMSEVNRACKEERKAITESFKKKTDEPFEGNGGTMEDLPTL